MRHALRVLATEEGSAALEFLGAGVVLLVPIVYLVAALSSVQSAAFAVEGAARQAARLAATASDERTAREHIAAAVDVALADYGVEGEADLGVLCAPDPEHCLTRDGRITVSVSADVPLPLAPTAFGSAPSSVTVTASATQPVSRFRTTPAALP